MLSFKYTFNALLIIGVLFQFNLCFAQSNDCSPSVPENLPLNYSCIYQNFNNSENGTGQTINASCASGYGTAYQDIWYSVVGTGLPITITVSNPDENAVLAAFTGCGTGQLACTQVNIGATGSIVFASILATTYYIQIQRRSGNSNANQKGEICATTLPPPPQNDEPCSAILLDVEIYCNSITYTNAGATLTASPGDPGCANWASGPAAADVWFKLVVPPTGMFNVETNAQVINNSGMALYSSPTNDCSNLVYYECDDTDGQGSMSLISCPATLTPGDTVWVRIWENGNDNNGTFDICAYSITACQGAPNNNDFCESPGLLTYCPPCSFSTSTASTYTADDPAGMDGNPNPIGFGCGSLQNNSWYTFTAGFTSDTFSVVSLANCVDPNNGIQAHVYEVSHDINGCCTAFSSVSTCFGNIVYADIPLDIIASGLTVGNTYVLMIDGYAGNNCDFTIQGWDATGILPVELAELSGITFSDKNVISWKTISEQNNDYFRVLRSYDGVLFEPIAQLDGAGNSNQILTYQSADYEIRTGIVYYQLDQVNFDGGTEKSEIITLDRNAKDIGLISIYPNPSETQITVEVNVSNNEGSLITIENLEGRLFKTHRINEHGMYKIQFDISDLERGIYIVRYSDSKATSVHKLILK